MTGLTIGRLQELEDEFSTYRDEMADNITTMDREASSLDVWGNDKEEIRRRHFYTKARDDADSIVVALEELEDLLKEQSYSHEDKEEDINY